MYVGLVCFYYITSYIHILSFSIFYSIRSIIEEKEEEDLIEKKIFLIIFNFN